CALSDASRGSARRLPGGQRLPAPAPGLAGEERGDPLGERPLRDGPPAPERPRVDRRRTLAAAGRRRDPPPARRPPPPPRTPPPPPPAPPPPPPATPPPPR